MAYFNKDKKSSRGKGGKKFGVRSFGGDRGGSRGFSGRRGGDRPEMHSAKCSACGKNCEVPFRPSGEKPVYCKDCFKGEGDDNSRGFRDGGRRDFGGRDSKPRFGYKPSYQHDGGKSTENYKAQFEQLNSKLDRILKALNPAGFENTKETNTPKSEKLRKAPKKEVDTAALKKVITKAIDKKPATKKVAVKE
ncbi:hypothetical protein MYX76_02500 [Desulfobacterota bacterium AH_259_B03_O07]|nr:hypothetical protein [Desulfobacterota bacterium AH_259_B03_O07]